MVLRVRIDQLSNYVGYGCNDCFRHFADGKYIAVGSHDNFIYLYTVSEDGRGYKKHGKLSVSQFFVNFI